MLCQQIVENERRGEDIRVLKSIIATLKDGDRLISAKEMDRVDVLDAAIGQAQGVRDSDLKAKMRRIFVSENIKGKTCEKLASEVEAITPYGFCF